LINTKVNIQKKNVSQYLNLALFLAHTHKFAHRTYVLSKINLLHNNIGKNLSHASRSENWFRTWDLLHIHV